MNKVVDTETTSSTFAQVAASPTYRPKNSGKNGQPTAAPTGRNIT
ncbi:MAG: hypothetical protein WCG03_05730 [Kiritimatiellales bacterium]